MGKTEVRDAGNMKPGNLVKYSGPPALGNPEYLGLILEHHGTWVKIFWAGLGNVQEFNIGNPKNWKVIG